MPNWIAITWENDRLMLLSASVHNGAPIFDRAECLIGPAARGSAFAEVADAVTETTDSPETGRARSPSLKKQFADFVQKNRLQKAEVVVVLSRSDVEVRPMLFPPVPPEELPDLVKFQATKEFNGYDASAPLDFFITNKLENVSRSTLFPAVTSLGKPVEKKPAPVSTGAPKHLIASTLRAPVLRKIQEFCNELNLTLRRIVLRPCEAAYLYRQSDGFDPGRSVLFVELDAVETSQAVLFQGEPVFMRSPKIGCPEDVSASDFAARLVAELKRTRIAVRNEIQGVTVDDVVLCGVGMKFESLAAQVSEGLDIPVKTFDPWSGAVRSGELRNNVMPDRPERYASLIGALFLAAKPEPSEIDFCNPKKRPEPAGHRQLITGVLAATLVALTCLLGYGFYSRAMLTEDVKRLTNEMTALQRTAATVQVQQAQLGAIDSWQANDVNWFEQLDWLSRKAPKAQDMILTELSLDGEKGGTMKLKSLLKDASIVSPMEENLRSENHDITTGEKRESKTNAVSPMYGFRYDLTVYVSRKSTEGEEKPATTDTAPEAETTAEAAAPPEPGSEPPQKPAEEPPTEIKDAAKADVNGEGRQ